VGQFGGAHVAGAVALSAAVYFGMNRHGGPIWRRHGLVFAAMLLIVLADAKQVFAAFFGGLLALMVIRLDRLKAMAAYLAVMVLGGVLMVVAAQTIFPALTTWTTRELMWRGLESTLEVFSILGERCGSGWEWVLGQGPGHTIGRLGWLMPDYWQVLEPLGATASPTTLDILIAGEANWMSNSRKGSSMWSMLFSWAGIVGDLGVAGVVSYGLLWAWVYRRLCDTEVTRFLVLTVMVFGCIFAWLEEPAYVLMVACLIGIDWQQRQQGRLGNEEAAWSEGGSGNPGCVAVHTAALSGEIEDADTECS
jgi:hypothetical protein